MWLALFVKLDAVCLQQFQRSFFSFSIEGGSRDIVYAIMDEDDAKEVWGALNEPKPTLVAVSGVDWNRELSPWPAPKAFRGSDDFGDGAPVFLGKLTRHIVPLVENRLDFTPSC